MTKTKSKPPKLFETHVRLLQADHERLAAVAARESRSITKQIEHCIRAFLAQEVQGEK